MTGLNKNSGIAVMGLGYVGLPLAQALSKSYRVIGYDCDSAKVEQCVKGELNTTQRLVYSDQVADIVNADIYIVTVPTPVDENNMPDLSSLMAVSTTLSSVLTKGNLIIYESTVFPGCTDEVCVPILEKSGLQINKDFYVGYSPERVSPGDSGKEVSTVSKIISASSERVIPFMQSIYRNVTSGEVYVAESIMVAEAAKALENTQRDLNIALINQACIFFKKIGLDAKDVVKAASTKWNFMNVTPGLVGGHCIGVDPYYLIHKADVAGVSLSLAKKAREINESFVGWIFDEIEVLMQNRGANLSGSSVLIIGASYKKDVGDIRNSKVISLAKKFVEADSIVKINDPLVDVGNFGSEIAVLYTVDFYKSNFDIVIYAVDHKEFYDDSYTAVIEKMIENDNVLFCDLTGRFPIGDVDFYI